MAEHAIVVDNISKTFRLYHERAHSVKERLVNLRRAEFEQFWALRDVALEIPRGDTAGLIGPNGSGKTTLLKLIAGIIRPTSGRIETRGRIASLLELGAGFHPDLTGRQNIYLNASILGLSKKETDKYYDAIVAFSELEKFIDMQVRHYSSGMYIRLGFAVAVHVDPQILIVDEVLSVGDEAFQRKCLERIRSFQRDGRTIVFVTHAVDTVRAVCTRAYFLWEGRLRAEGEPGEVIREYRHLLHGDPEADSSSNEQGDGRVRILRVRLTDAEGRERATFQSGEDLHVIIDLEAPDPIDDVMAGISIHDDQESVVLGTNSEIAGAPLGTLHGKLRMTYVCRALPISGNFALTVGITTRDHQTKYHWQERAYAFRYEATGGELGIVRSPVAVTAERL